MQYPVLFPGRQVLADERDRILRALRLCTLFCLGSGLLLAALLALFAGLLPLLFSDNPAVVEVTKLFLWLAPIGYGTYGMVMVMNAAFNGLGKPMPGVIVSLLRTIIIYVPLAVVGDHWFGIPGIFAAYAVANVVTGVIAYAWARRVVGQQCQREAVPYRA